MFQNRKSHLGFQNYKQNISGFIVELTFALTQVQQNILAQSHITALIELYHTVISTHVSGHPQETSGSDQHNSSIAC